MKRLLIGSLLAALLALAGATPAAAGPWSESPFFAQFDDIDPCMGLVHTVTITGSVFAHEHDGRIHGHSHRTITTSPTGYVGHGTASLVVNGQVESFVLTDTLTNASGDRIRAHVVFVLDLSTGVVRVGNGGVTCVGA